MLFSRKLKAGSLRLDQRGLTSVVVVFVLVLVLTLLSIAFTKVMNRSLQTASSNQQAAAANYAAQSGVNDAIAYINQALASNPNANVSAAECDDLIKPGAPLAGAAQLSASTTYTCVLVDPTPTSLFYQGVPPHKSQIVKITTSAPLSSLLFSWQATDSELNQFVPQAQGQTLFDETVWSNSKYAPLLRITIYPIPASGDLSGVQAASKTFFLYPQTGGGSNAISYNSASGLAAVNCPSKNLGGFSGSAEYDCNLVVNNLPGGASASYFYVRLSPYYGQADVKLKGNDGSSQPVEFIKVQSVIDVTAKSGNSTKRLQARTDASGSNFNISPASELAPEFSVQTTDTLCKRLIVPPSSGSPVQVESGSAANCGLTLPPPPPPTVALGTPTGITTNSATLNGTVNPNGYNVTNCRFDYGTSPSYGSSAGCNPSPGGGSSAVSVSANLSGLNSNTTYNIRLCATNVGGQGCTANATFKTLRPPASFTFSADSTSLPYGGSTTLRWSGSDVDWCWGWGGKWGSSRPDGRWVTPPSGGSDSTGNLTSTTTYNLVCDQHGKPGSTKSVTVNVAPQPPPPPPPPPQPPPPPPPLTIKVELLERTNWLRLGFQPSGCDEPAGQRGTHSYLLCVRFQAKYSDDRFVTSDICRLILQKYNGSTGVAGYFPGSQPSRWRTFGINKSESPPTYGANLTAQCTQDGLGTFNSATVYIPPADCSQLPDSYCPPPPSQPPPPPPPSQPPQQPPPQPPAPLPPGENCPPGQICYQ